MGDLAVYSDLFIAAFGAATILPLQSEAVLGLRLAGNYPTVLLIVVVSGGNVLGATANWLLGIGIERFKDREWFPVSAERLAQAQRWYQRYGKWSLLRSWLPIVGDPLRYGEGYDFALLLKTPLVVYCNKGNQRNYRMRRTTTGQLTVVRKKLRY